MPGDAGHIKYRAMWVASPTTALDLGRDGFQLEIEASDGPIGLGPAVGVAGVRGGIVAQAVVKVVVRMRMSREAHFKTGGTTDGTG